MISQTSHCFTLPTFYCMWGTLTRTQKPKFKPAKCEIHPGNPPKKLLTTATNIMQRYENGENKSDTMLRWWETAVIRTTTASQTKQKLFCISLSVSVWGDKCRLFHQISPRKCKVTTHYWCLICNWIQQWCKVSGEGVEFEFYFHIFRLPFSFLLLSRKK